MLVFPATVVNDPVTPLVTVAFCQAIVPIASLNVIVVPVPLHTVDNPDTVPAVAVGIIEY